MCGGACVSWFSRSQKYVTLPAKEAEYVAMAETKLMLLLKQALV